MKTLFKNKILAISGMFFLFTLTACVTKTGVDEQYYTEADFLKMNKIDVHCHVNTRRPNFMEQAVADNFRILTIIVGASDRKYIDEQQEIANFQRKAFPGRIAYLTAFTMDGWDNDDWQQKTIAYLDSSFKNGAIGIKVWKNIGMTHKDKCGNFIMIDNPKFDTIFNYLTAKGIPVCGHLGEPRNCWLPIEKMTVNNDKNYFRENPQYHMYLHPEYPNYEQQIAARDHMLTKHPDLKFMAAHLGSMEWSVDMMAEHLDRFPNMVMDMAERICHLQVQAQNDWQKVRDFFMKYQDRLLYGTDRGDYGGIKEENIKSRAHETWVEDWKFFTTDEMMTSKTVEGEFKGLKLPRDVVDKIYYKNAEKLFPALAELKNQEK
ncbi:MAG: amidohydrolase family protein [Prolixibacteraceae bacterium]|jgi:predicted TIM-barrel fold metal-dependent hydrolase|nr:amidohydrolase family protein [Prolixibacteraceae bacterium]